MAGATLAEELTLHGRPSDEIFEDAVRRAADLRPFPLGRWPRVFRARAWLWAGRLDAARREFLQMQKEAVAPRLRVPAALPAVRPRPARGVRGRSRRRDPVRRGRHRGRAGRRQRARDHLARVPARTRGGAAGQCRAGRVGGGTARRLGRDERRAAAADDGRRDPRQPRRRRERLDRGAAPLRRDGRPARRDGLRAPGRPSRPAPGDRSRRHAGRPRPVRAAHRAAARAGGGAAGAAGGRAPDRGARAARAAGRGSRPRGRVPGRGGGELRAAGLPVRRGPGRSRARPRLPAVRPADQGPGRCAGGAGDLRRGRRPRVGWRWPTSCCGGPA